jgi:hypothetical protein
MAGARHDDIELKPSESWPSPLSPISIPGNPVFRRRLARPERRSAVSTQRPNSCFSFWLACAVPSNGRLVPGPLVRPPHTETIALRELGKAVFIAYGWDSSAPDTA